MAEPFDLRDYDSRTHARWLALIEQRLSKHREANDNTQADDRQTAITRGRIAELKELLTLARKPAPATEQAPDRRPAFLPDEG